MKVTGSYAKITGGVSEQDPYSRVEGQVTEQVNLLTDPLRGLVRRHGSEIVGFSEIEAGTDPTDAKRVCSTYRNFNFTMDNTEYILGYRNKNLGTELEKKLPPYLVSRHRYTDGGDAQALEVDHIGVKSGQDALDIAVQGFSAVTNIGKFLLLAPNDTPVSFTSQPVPDSYKNLGTVWVRAGTYSKEYTLIFNYNGTQHTVKYKTNPSSFPVGMDTSKITWGSDKYNQVVNSLTAVYNGASAQYIGEAAAKIQPQYIAAQLARLIYIAIGKGSENNADIGGGEAIVNDIVIPSANGETVTQWVTPSHKTQDIWSVGVVNGRSVKVPWGMPYNISGKTVQQSEGYILTGLEPGIEFQVSLDEGQNESMYTVQKAVSDLKYLSPMHYAGAVVQIKPTASKENIAGVYYRAYGVGNDEIDGVFKAVYWEECTIDEVVPEFVFLIATVYNDTLYVAKDPEKLQTLLDADGASIEVPEFIPRSVGDVDSSPIPAFAGQKITYMGTFQDRLMIISGNVLNFSRSGDYFNFFSKSVQKVVNEDPVEIYPTGSEGDVMYSAVSSGKNFLIFGNGWQYLLSGSVVLTPTNSDAVMKLSAFNNDNTVQPVASGNYCFYVQVGEFGTSLQEIPVAYLTDSPSTDNASSQLQHYIKGDVQFLEAGTNPNTVVIKTNGYSNGFYVMRYEDAPQQGGHVVNSWFKIEYNEAMGYPLTLRVNRGRIVVDFLRYYKSSETEYAFLRVTESFSLDTDNDSIPYIDSWCKWGEPKYSKWKEVFSSDGYVTEETASFAYAKGDYWLMGIRFNLDYLPKDPVWDGSKYIVDTGTLPTLDNLYAGFNFDTYVEPTNPYLRNAEGVASRNGRLITGMIKVYCADSGSCELIRMNQYGENKKVLRKKEGTLRITSDYKLGQDPVGDVVLSGYVGKEVTLYTYRIQGTAWYPLNITKIDWTGQYFNNQGRV